MALDSFVSWGNQIAAALKALNISDSSKITDSQLELVWQTIKEIDREQLTDKMEATGTTDVTIGSSQGVYTSTIPTGGHS